MKRLFLHLLLLLFTISNDSWADEKEYVASLAHEIVQNLERQIKQDELLVSLDLFKTKKEKKIIPLGRLLREELLKQLDASSKVTLPAIPSQKTDYLLTGFIRLKGEKAELFAKIVNTKTDEKLAFHEIPALETKWQSLYEEHFDDYLQEMVEKTAFPLGQNFFVEKPAFQGNPEPKLGEYVRKTLSGMLAYQVDVLQEKGPSSCWTVRTEIAQASGEYHVAMTLVTDIGNKDYAAASATIPARLAPFHLKNVAARRFVIVSAPSGAYARHLEVLKTAVGNFMESQNIVWVNEGSLNETALRWLENKAGKNLKEKTDYVIETLFLVEISEPKGEEVAGGVKGTLSLNVYDSSAGGLKTQVNLSKGGVYVNKRDIEREIDKITKNIQGQLGSALKDKFSGL